MQRRTPPAKARALRRPGRARAAPARPLATPPTTIPSGRRLLPLVPPRRLNAQPARSPRPMRTPSSHPSSAGPRASDRPSSLDPNSTCNARSGEPRRARVRHCCLPSQNCSPSTHPMSRRVPRLRLPGLLRGALFPDPNLPWPPPKHVLSLPNRQPRRVGDPNSCLDIPQFSFEARHPECPSFPSLRAMLSGYEQFIGSTAPCLDKRWVWRTARPQARQGRVKNIEGKTREGRG